MDTINTEAHNAYLADVTYVPVKPNGKIIGYKGADGKILIVKNLKPGVVQKYTVFYNLEELDVTETLQAAKNVGINAHKAAMFELI